MDSLFIILVGALVSINCSIIGSYLMLKKMSMIGDAISHSILPGIVISFLITKSKTSITMIIGSSIIGVITILIIEFLNKKIKIKKNSSIGIVFTFMFSLGVILISLFTKKIDLDQECVLYGELSYVPLNLWITKNGINLGPKPIYILVIILIINIIFVKLNYKELYITTFDPKFSNTIGINSKIWNYLIMIISSVTIVTSFESVGSILVLSMIIIPPATAYLLTKKLKVIIIISGIIGIINSLLGYFLAYYTDGSISSAMSIISGIIFFTCFIIKKLKK